MGTCCNSTKNQTENIGKAYSSNPVWLLKEQIAQCIEDNQIKEFIELWGEHFGKESAKVMKVDDSLDNISGANYNALGFALRLGRKEIFQFLCEEAGANIQNMEKRFSYSNRTAIDIICENGFLDLLQYFLPLYLEKNQKDKTTKLPGNSMIAVQSHQGNRTLMRNAVIRACDKGQLEIVQYLYNYFKDQKGIPEELDVYSEDERSGENTAMIAAKNGHFQLLK